MTTTIPVDRNRFRLAGALSASPSRWGPARIPTTRLTTAGIPEDYRLRHPIALQEADQSVVIFIGRGRGGLSASQRADVIGLAKVWLHEATGPIIADVPVGYPERSGRGGFAPRNPGAAPFGRRAAAWIYRPPLSSRRSAPDGDDPAELSEDLRGGRALRPVARGSRPVDQEPELPREQVVLQFRLRLSAQHGGDGRQSVGSRAAATETPPYTARRTAAFEKYRKGTPTATIYPESDKAKLSDTGK